VRRDLDDVVARVGVRAGEAGREAVVDPLARVRVAQARAEDRARRIGMEWLETACGEGKGAAARQTD